MEKGTYAARGTKMLWRGSGESGSAALWIRAVLEYRCSEYCYKPRCRATSYARFSAQVQVALPLNAFTTTLGQRSGSNSDGDVIKVCAAVDP